LDAASCVIMDRVGAILNLCWICRLDVPTKILRMGLAVLMVRSEWGCAGVCGCVGLVCGRVWCV
jgi:hypothetical protein